MIATFTREEFLADYFDYRVGEHLLIIAPTGSGKSYLAWQLLQEAQRQHPEIGIRVLMPKPADQTTTEWSAQLGIKETPVWPPKVPLFGKREQHYVVWPPHAMNLDPDDRHELIGRTLRKALDDSYRRGNSLTFIDDTHSAAAQLGLGAYLEELVVNGRANNAAAWMATQKPSGTLQGGVTTMAYGNSTHLFFSRDRDKNNVKRFGEIGGVDPRLVENEVSNLKVYRVGGRPVSEFLYVDARGPYVAKILPS